VRDGTYEVRVSGPVPEEAVADFGEIRVTPVEVTTVLGGIGDQSSLLGLLSRLRSLGLHVMEVRRVRVAAPGEPSTSPQLPSRPAGMTRGDGRTAHGGNRGARVHAPGEDTTMTDDLEQSGPIDYLVVEFPGSRMTGEAFPILVDLVDRGLIRILDLAFISKGEDGSIVGLDLTDIDGDGVLDLTVFEGAASGLLDSDDLDDAGSVLEPGSSAGVLVYENVWAAPFATALRRSGGQLVASGRIPVQAILAALESTEPVG